MFPCASLSARLRAGKQRPPPGGTQAWGQARGQAGRGVGSAPGDPARGPMARVRLAVDPAREPWAQVRPAVGSGPQAPGRRPLVPLRSTGRVPGARTRTGSEDEAMRMDEPIFSGVGVALATFFDEDGEIDAKATADHASTLVGLGVQAVVVAGSTGEAASLAPDERVALLEAVRGAVPAGIPVLQGTGAPSARQAAALTRDARDHGADAVLTLSPPGTNDPRRYYQAVAEAAGDLSVLAYHYPQVSPPGLDLQALAELPVRGMKDSSGDPDRLLSELATFRGWLYVGAAPILALAGPLGCAGAILAVANAEPELCIAAFAGDAAAQRRLTPSHLATKRDFPHGLKELIAKRFGTSTAARLG